MTPVTLTDDAPYDFIELNRDLDRAKSKVFLGENATFFGSLMCSLDFEWSESIETAGTDGKTFWWAPKDFRDNMDAKEGRPATIKHELWHVARLHMLRQGNRDQKIWNIACDVRINRDLRKEGYVLPPPWWIPDMPEIPHEVEEDIYEFIKQKCNGGGKGKNGQPSTGIPGLDQALAGGGHNDHMIPGSSKNKQKIVNAVVKAIHQTKMAGGKEAGNIPGGVEKLVQKFLAPVVPWEAALNQWMRDLLDEDYTWRRPSRRHDPNELYLPSRFEDEGRLEHLLYFWDVSGSISDDDEIRFNSEVKHIWDYFKPKKLTLAQFDTRITKIDVFNDGDTFDGVKVIGKGGTCLRPVRQLITELKPTAAIIFSDLFVAPMEQLEKPIPIIWIAVNNKDAVVPFGKLIHIKG